MAITKHIARIESTRLGFEDHGILTFELVVVYGAVSQSIGGFALSYDINDPSKPPPPTNPRTGDFVVRILRACGVSCWERLVGRTIYVLFQGQMRNNDRPIGIENLPTELGERFLFADLGAE